MASTIGTAVPSITISEPIAPLALSSLPRLPRAPSSSTDGELWRDAFERIVRTPSESEAILAEKKPEAETPAGDSRRLRGLVRRALKARELIGTADEQFTPGVREYLFPEPVAELKGLDKAKTLIFGERGLLQGFKQMFYDRMVGKGFAKVLSSVIFLPFTLVAMVVDLPRLGGDFLIQASNKWVLKGVGRGGIRGSLWTMAGGFGRALGGICKMGVPIAAICLGLLAGGWPGVVAAVLFETVYFGEDLTHLTAGEFEEMSLFKGLQDIVGGLAIIFGAEFVHKLNQSTVNRLMGGETDENQNLSQA